MKQVQSVTRERLKYIDDNGVTQFIDLRRCSQNWIEYHRQYNENVDEDNAYVAWRNICANPPYILFFTDPKTKFEFKPDPTSDCEAEDGFYLLQRQLRRVGWLTMDLA